MFVVDEIYVRGIKLIEYPIWFVKVQEIIPKDHPRVLDEGPKLVAKTVKRHFTYGGQSMASGLIDAP